MTGSSRRRRSSNPIRFVRSVWATGIAVLVAACSVAPGLAQSGRVREPKTAPPVATPPTSKPTSGDPPKPGDSPTDSPKPIPSGGSVLAQDANGAIIRTELANGTVFVVRENSATVVASVVTAIRIPEGADKASALELARVATRSGADSPAARVAAVGGMIEVSTDGAFLSFASSVMGRDAEVAVVAHAASIAAQDGRPGTLALTTQRSTVVASGRVNAFGMLATVQREFGGIQPPAPPVASPAAGRRVDGRPPPVPIAPPPAPAAVPTTQSTRYDVVPGAAGPASVTVSFDPLPDSVVDGAVVEVLASALGVGRTSRLGLAYGESAFAVGASAHVEWIGPGRSLVFTIATDVARIDDASAMAWRELDRLRRERITAAELQRACNQAELEEVLRRSRPDDDAADLLRLELGMHDVAASSNRQRRYRTVTAVDVQAAASRLFTIAGASVVESVPPGSPARPASPASFAARVAVWAPGVARAVAPGEIRDRPAMPSAPEGAERGRSGDRPDSVLMPLPLPARDFSTLNGPNAFVREDASQPVVAVGFYFPGGRSAELPNNRGITELMLRTMLRGSKGFPGDALLFGIERFGGRVRIVNESDFFGFVIETLSRNAHLVVPIAIDLVEQPQFETVAVLRERDRLVADLRPSRMQAAVAASNLFWQGRYPTHAYGVAAEGMPESVTKQTDESVRAWYGTSVQALYPLVGIVGDTDGSSLVSQFVVDGFDRPEGERLGSPAVPAPSPVSEVATPVPSATTLAAIGSITPGGGWDALEAIEIALRAVQVRVAASTEGGAVLDIACGLERRRQAGAAVCRVVSSVDMESKARAVVMSEFARVTSAGWSAEEIVAGRRAATVAWTLETSRGADMNVAYVRATSFGLPLDTVERYGERLEALPADGVRRVAVAVLEASRIGRGVVRGVPGR